MRPLHHAPPRQLHTVAPRNKLPRVSRSKSQENRAFRDLGEQYDEASRPSYFYVFFFFFFFFLRKKKKKKIIFFFFFLKIFFIISPPRIRLIKRNANWNI